MANTPKLSVILGNLGSAADRFLTTGYRPAKSVHELFEATRSLPDLRGIELVEGWHITPDNVPMVKAELERTGLSVCSVIPNNFGEARWGKGSYADKNPAIRRQAVAGTKAMMDVAAELGCPTVSLWPGQDGYDYSFQADYMAEHDWLAESIRECADYRKDVRLALEYKIKEPRTHSYINTVGNTLLLVQEIGRDNVGVTIDTGHALMAYENMAESAVLLKRYGDKLFHLHLNDNYRLWDDDMMVSSVHVVENIELFYWLDRIGYDGWYSVDEYPYREDPVRAVGESLAWIKGLHRMLDRIGRDRMKAVIDGGDATAASAMLREALLPG